MDVNTYEFFREKRYAEFVKKMADRGEDLYEAIMRARRSRETFPDRDHPDRLDDMSSLYMVFEQLVKDVIADQSQDT